MKRGTNMRPAPPMSRHESHAFDPEGIVDGSHGALSLVLRCACPARFEQAVFGPIQVGPLDLLKVKTPPERAQN